MQNLIVIYIARENLIQICETRGFFLYFDNVQRQIDKLNKTCLLAIFKIIRLQLSRLYLINVDSTDGMVRIIEKLTKKK